MKNRSILRYNVKLFFLFIGIVSCNSVSTEGKLVYKKKGSLMDEVILINTSKTKQIQFTLKVINKKYNILLPKKFFYENFNKLTVNSIKSNYILIDDIKVFEENEFENLYPGEEEWITYTRYLSAPIAGWREGTKRKLEFLYKNNEPISVNKGEGVYYRFEYGERKVKIVGWLEIKD